MEDGGGCVGWQVSLQNWMAINVDIIVDVDSGEAAIGWVIQDAQRASICVFMRKIGVAPLLSTKLRAAYKDLKIAQGKDYQLVILESDMAGW
ncbi:hypothetical protein PVK06_011119 [Gossypium arboreum]|uniref:Uncharacterized protein n=1 Tax=Gossypium arboreum TaxID=29729 RepID=A0ABR0Q8W5_GOSAR|nr:hypothetical protein PVK06_011119 [Gossypium arboreum]